MYYVTAFDIYVSPPDAATILGISRQRVYQLVKARRLDARDVRGRLGISGRALAERRARLHNEPVEPRNLGELDAWLTSSIRRGRRGRRATRKLAQSSERRR